MQIECIRKREGGTKLTLGATTYHFKPNGKGAHIADVTDKGHMQTLLRIAAYELYLDDDGADALGVATVAVDPADEDDDTDPNPAPATNSAPIEGADEAEEGEGEGEGDEGQPEGEGGSTGDPTSSPADSKDYASMTEPQLRVLYKEKIGREAMPTAKTATLIKKLQAHDAGE